MTVLVYPGQRMTGIGFWMPAIEWMLSKAAFYGTIGAGK
jgi:hypothetical protein